MGRTRALTGPLTSEGVLEQLGSMETVDRQDLRAIVELATRIADVPAGVINILTDTEQHQIAAIGFEPSVCAREDSMCRLAVDAQTSVVLADASLDARYADNPFVTGEIAEVRFYAAHLLRTREGEVIGTLCVFDDQPRELDAVRAGALDALARRVVDILELSLRSGELERSIAELTAMQTELERSNAQLGRFAGQVSHDLLNPLSAVSMSLDLIEETGVAQQDADAGWALERARSGLVRMQRLIADLLAYARLGASLRREPVDLGAVVDTVLEDLSTVLQGAVVDIGELPVVAGDEVQLRSVLQNLLANAAKFTRPLRTPRLVVRGGVRGKFGRVEVIDNGPGIPAERREGVFELLTRETTDVPGSGIGLATCRAIVTGHGGRIGIEDAPDGPGTLVWFELPVPD
ncbi:sensor histidine kinase [Nocardioides massiliensis]|uniref:Sensor-like histidine kinase SenX3 n=1 Tax=Nocardioides massiliensis TaxID=1325935 RepID=A0ABT9NT50_9ACTN|nr:GAF domain-containing sensor histidine kinase [Nocardioides massiliensis]MDP9823597.1 signal transduction histidine kinase [Nocardioides massiliensis]